MEELNAKQKKNVKPFTKGDYQLLLRCFKRMAEENRPYLLQKYGHVDGVTL